MDEEKKDSITPIRLIQIYDLFVHASWCYSLTLISVFLSLNPVFAIAATEHL
jgi:hypothetical protein